ncbi:ShlB/FhaC/HecB family hemolysin secretion/activation protein [Uliginosibacterium flavum]|uniref:ShlB/FhaC/HecB family hemolysin secretion/activation protein n=1 Tax=Uliginosibacterium flavum TaxID=1396831 RepID=A0ABV2TGE4_9RHOO
MTNLYLLRVRSLIALGFACVLLFVAAWAHAQTPADTQEQRRRAQQEEEDRQNRLNAPRVELERPAAADPKSFELPDEKPCFRITRIKLEGKQLDRFFWLNEQFEYATGRCVGKEGLSRIVKKLTASLIDRGYITTRIGIPEQDLSKGELSLLLIPGTVGKVRMADGSPDVSWRTAFPIRPGDLLNLRDLEQGLEQLKRVPSQDVDFEIQPGEHAGESDIVIKAQRSKPWRVAVSADDAGSKATGKYQASLSLSLDNPLGLNDLLSVTTNSDAQRDRDELGSRGNSASYSIPFGYWLISTGVSRSRFHQTIAGANQDFVSSGKSEQTDLKILRTLHRDQTSKTSAYARLIKRKSHSFIDDTEIEVQRRNTTALELALNRRQYLGRAQMDFTLGYKEGNSWFGGQNDPADLPAEAPSFDYHLEFADISASVPFAVGELPLRWISALRAQSTGSRLYANEMFSIGGRYTVRGFDGETTLAAERGWYWRNEMELPIAASGQNIFLAYDHGEVAGPSAAHLAGKTLGGVAVGLRGTWQGASYEVFAGWPVERPKSFRTPQPTVGFQASYQY